jgi:hypothetical protein
VEFYRFCVLMKTGYYAFPFASSCLAESPAEPHLFPGHCRGVIPWDLCVYLHLCYRSFRILVRYLASRREANLSRDRQADLAFG